MNKIFLLIVLYVILLLVFGCSSSSIIDPNDYVKTNLFMNQRIAGANVFIELNNGQKYTGELLFVRDSTMLLCKEYGANEEDLSKLVSKIIIIKNYDIELIEIQGENFILTGIVIGTAAGAVVGIVAGASDGDDPEVGIFTFTAEQKACMSGCAGGIVGSLLGLIAGAISSTNDKDIYNYSFLEHYDFKQLNFFSRYQADEPDYLKEIN